MRVAYKLSVGGWSIDSAADPRTELLEADVSLRLNSPGDRCELILFAPPPPAPDLQGQAIAAASSLVGLGGVAAAPPAPSVPVRGVDFKHGDAVGLELAADDVSAAVVTASVQSFESSPTTLSIVARTGVQKLADARLDQVYENQTTASIVRDVAAQAGVTAGDVGGDRTWPYVVVDRSRSALRHLEELASREGADLYFDAGDRLCLKAFTKTAADHTLHYGIDLLALSVRREAKSAERVEVYGESPASQRGTSAWPWLVKDLAPLGGSVGSGVKLRARSDAALRTKDAADGRAAALLGGAGDGALRGQLLLLGRPDIALADAVEVKSAPQKELNGLYKVTGVRHRLGKATGFVTVLAVSGQGGAAQAGGLLGELGGALAGALGL
jgi:phage protein D